MTQQPHPAALRAAEAIRVLTVTRLKLHPDGAQPVFKQNVAELIDRELGLSELERMLTDALRLIAIADKECGHDVIRSMRDHRAEATDNVRAALARLRGEK